MLEKYFDKKIKAKRPEERLQGQNLTMLTRAQFFFPGAFMHPIEPSYLIGIWVSISSGTFSKLAKITKQNLMFFN